MCGARNYNGFVPAEDIEDIEDILERVVIVLVRARNPQNIGAAARAMHDFGFRHLRVVNEYEVPFEGARSAVDAAAVLAAATTHASLEEAIADCTLVVGTTAVGEREVRHPLLMLAEAAPVIRAEVSGSADGRVAILFGSEKTGLANDELSFCHVLLTIPMYPHAEVRHASMNLGQAVAVCLWELVRAEEFEGMAKAVRAGEVAAPASAELERLSAMLGEVLEGVGYGRRHPAHASAADVRRLVRRMVLDQGDVPVWMGIFRQILWKMGAGAAPHTK